MGLLYITDGSIPFSILGSMFLVICYFFVVQLLKKNKEVMMKNNFLHGSILFWFFFLMLGYVSFYLMSHFINIEYNCKDQIKQEASGKIKLVDKLAADYKKRSREDILNFEAQLKTKLTNYKITKNKNIKNELTQEPFNVNAAILINPEFINVDQVANAKVNPYQLKIDKNNKNIEKTISLNSKKYQSIFDNWKRFSLVVTYSKLNQYVDDNTNLINTKIAELPLVRTPIKPSFNRNQIPLNNPSKLNKLYPPQFTLPLIIILIIHMFILIPFLSHKVRGYKNSSPKNKTNKTTRGTSENKQKGTIEL
jgi:Ca2+/Na+ antiporter